MMENPDSDARLMLDFKNGSDKAFEQIVNRFRKNVLNLIYRYLGANHAFAEDLAQEVFLRVYRAKASYRSTAKLSTWIYKIAINLCLNEQRRRRPRPFSSLPLNDQSQAPGASDIPGKKSSAPPDEIEKGETRSAVRRAVEALPEKQRLAIILNKYEQLSYEDIAETMSCSVPAVRSLLFRARQGLKSSLAKYVKK